MPEMLFKNIYIFAVCFLESSTETALLYCLIAKIGGCRLKKVKRQPVFFVLLQSAYAAGSLLQYRITEYEIIWSGMALSLLLFVYFCIVSQEKLRKTLLVLAMASGTVAVVRIAIANIFVFVDGEEEMHLFLRGIWGVLEILTFFLFVCAMFFIAKKYFRETEPITVSNIILLIFFDIVFGMAVIVMQPINFMMDFSQPLEAVSKIDGAYAEYIQILISIIWGLYANYSLSVAVVILGMILLVFLILGKNVQTGFYRKQSMANAYYLELQKVHYDSLARSNVEVRRIRHDMKNHLFCMKELLNLKKYSELADYLESICREVSSAEMKVHVGNEIADAIITEKLRVANEKGIRMEIDGNFAGVQLAALDICTILANLLDNAVEATAGQEEENRWIHLSFQKTEHFYLLTEENPVEKQVVIKEQSIASTKKDKVQHGFGLKNIKDAAASYGGELSFACEPRGEGGYLFRMEILLPNQN